MLIQVGARSAAAGLHEKRKTNPIVAAFGLTVLGALAGLLISLILPNRLFPISVISGASIVLSPLLTGYVMHRYGIWCRERGHETSYIATFWGGGLFALGMAVVRFLLVGADG